ncbi:MAG: hypothetical protein J0I57_13255, partial [Hyphomicrobium sp.]|nr:hypothetical protein [Hyphomicrobium sp.]
MAEHELPPTRGLLSLTSRPGALAPVAGAAVTFCTLGAVHVAAAVLIGVLATFIAFAGWLIASDWQADVQSRHDWAEIGLTPAHLSPTVEAGPASDIGPCYLVNESDKTLRLLFLAHRAAAQTVRGVPAPASSTERPPAQAVPDRVSDAGAVSKADAFKLASSKEVSTRSAATKISSWKGRSREEVIAARVRLVANGDTWPAPIPLRVDKAADIIVLSDRQREPAPGLPEASVATNGAETTAQPTCRGPPRSRVRRAAVLPDPVVGDNFGPRLPIGRAELDVLETYLERELRELLGYTKQAGD